MDRRSPPIPSARSGPDIASHPLVVAANRVATEVLAPAASEVDRLPLLPRSHLDALAHVGLMGLVGPIDEGGQNAPPSVRRRVQQVIAGACGATCFTWMQHHAPVRFLSQAPDSEARRRWLRPLCRGEARGGVAFAYLRRPGPPAVRARAVGDGSWILEGSAPWVTGWGLIDLLLTVAACDDGRKLLCLVSVEAAGLCPTPLDLMVFGATGTVQLGFDGVRVGRDYVVDLWPDERWRQVDRMTTAQPVAALFGITEACVRGMREICDRGATVTTTAAALEDELARCLRRTEELDIPRPGEPGVGSDDRRAGWLAELLAVRSWSLDLANRSALAWVAAAGGRAISRSHPAQRLAREATFYLVQAQTDELRHAELVRLARPGDPPLAGAVIPAFGGHEQPPHDQRNHHDRHGGRDRRRWLARDAATVWHGFTQMSGYAESAAVVVEQAEGHELIDVEGNRYLDAISSLWVNTLGHRVPELDDALHAQLERVAHATMLGNGSRIVIELAEALAEVVPVDRPHFLFASDGAAAVEQALKIAFQYWVNVGDKGRTRYLALRGAYHGDTIGSLSLGDSGFGTRLFDPLCFDVLRAPGYADSNWIEAALEMMRRYGPELAAVVIEPLVQGAGGMRVAVPGAVERLGRACREAETLLICDEVATGFGRTGTLFASEQCGLRPDLLCLGKGLTGGYLPMSATVATQAVFESFGGPDLCPQTFYHGHSYGGNALAAAVALRHLQLFGEWNVLANVAERSVQLRALLDEHLGPLAAAVAEIRLCGLMGGVELIPWGPGEAGRRGRQVCAAAVHRGVLLRPLGDVVVLMPPLTATADEIQHIVAVLAEAIAEVTSL